MAAPTPESQRVYNPHSQGLCDDASAMVMRAKEIVSPRPAVCGMPVDVAFQEKAGYKVVSFESSGVDAVGYGTVFLVVFPQAVCGEHALDFLDQLTSCFDTPAKRVVLPFLREACSDHVRWRSGERHSDIERRQLWWSSRSS